MPRASSGAECQMLRRTLEGKKDEGMHRSVTTSTDHFCLVFFFFLSILFFHLQCLNNNILCRYLYSW